MKLHFPYYIPLWLARLLIRVPFVSEVRARAFRRRDIRRLFLSDVEPWDVIDSGMMATAKAPASDETPGA